eukprot:496489_1
MSAPSVGSVPGSVPREPRCHDPPPIRNWQDLLVQSSTFLQNDGSETASLLLTGTIAMFYRGVTYNTPIDMYLPPHYPNRPPITFVRPAASMMIKEGHNHVGSDGMVYMPYLSSWQKQSHNLVDACLNMSSIFSN